MWFWFTVMRISNRVDIKPNSPALTSIYDTATHHSARRLTRVNVPLCRVKFKKNLRRSLRVEMMKWNIMKDGCALMTCQWTDDSWRPPNADKMSSDRNWRRTWISTDLDHRWATDHSTSARHCNRDGQIERFKNTPRFSFYSVANSRIRKKAIPSFCRMALAYCHLNILSTGAKKTTEAMPS